MKWTDADEQEAFANGWAIFGYGGFRVIMKIDDIHQYREDKPCLNGVKNLRHFGSDDSATRFVKARAAEGYQTYEKALQLCPKQDDYIAGRI